MKKNLLKSPVNNSVKKIILKLIATILKIYDSQEQDKPLQKRIFL